MGLLNIVLFELVYVSKRLVLPFSRGSEVGVAFEGGGRDRRVPASTLKVGQRVRPPSTSWGWEGAYVFRTFTGGDSLTKFTSHFFSGIVKWLTISSCKQLAAGFRMCLWRLTPHPHPAAFHSAQGSWFLWIIKWGGGGCGYSGTDFFTAALTGVCILVGFNQQYFVLFKKKCAQLFSHVVSDFLQPHRL